MRYLLDTNIVSDLVRHPQGRIFEHIRKIGEAQICTSIIVAALVGKAAVTRDDKEPMDFRERSGDVFADPVGKKFLFGIGAHVLERKHRDRRLVGKRQRR